MCRSLSQPCSPSTLSALYRLDMAALGGGEEDQDPAEAVLYVLVGCVTLIAIEGDYAAQLHAADTGITLHSPGGDHAGTTLVDYRARVSMT